MERDIFPGSAINTSRKTGEPPNDYENRSKKRKRSSHVLFEKSNRTNDEVIPQKNGNNGTRTNRTSTRILLEQKTRMATLRSNTQKAKEAFGVYQSLQGELEKSVINHIRIGELLFKMKQDNLYKQILGDTRGKWQEFLGMPEIGQKYHAAYKFMALYEVFKLKFPTDDKRLSAIKESKLRMIYPFVTAQNKEGLLAAAESLSASDLGKT